MEEVDKERGVEDVNTETQKAIFFKELSTRSAQHCLQRLLIALGETF